MTDAQYHNAEYLVRLYRDNKIMYVPNIHITVAEFAESLGLNVSGLRKGCNSAMKRRMAAITKMYNEEKKRRQA